MYGNRLVACLFLTFLTPLLEADIVSLNNGDRVTGQVKSLAGGKLVVDTAYAGKIALDWSVVESFSSDRNLQVELEGGELVTGTVELEASEGLRVTTPAETMAFNRGQVIGFGPEPQPEDYGLLENWHGGLNLGMSVSRGNTDVSNLSFAADPSRETSRDRIAFFLSTLRSAQDGETTGSLYKLSGRYDRFLSEDLFLYGIGLFDKDEKADLDYRFREGGGLGYRFRKGDHTDVSLRGGISTLQEQFAGLGQTSSGVGNASMELRSSWLAPLALTAVTTYSPFLSREGRYLLEGLLGIRLPLFGNLNFGLDFVDSYDSSPPQDASKNDLRILSTVGWSF